MEKKYKLGQNPKSLANLKLSWKRQEKKLEEDTVTSMEDVSWDDTRYKSKHLNQISQSVSLLHGMKPGETKKLYHFDVVCHYCSNDATRQCTVLAALQKLRKTGWETKQYHEKDHVMVIKRTK